MPQSSSSPLGVVTDDPLLHQFVGYLQDARGRIEAEGSAELVFHRSRIAEVAHAFQRMIRRGEERLHRLAHKLIWVNPLKAGPGYEPTAQGMAAALPFCDEFLEGHCLRSVSELAAVISNADG